MSDRPRILVCDHESQSLYALRGVLHAAGFEMDPARTAAAALTRSSLRLPHAAIIELVLPDGDGVEVCRRLREWSAMPLILLSAESEEAEQVRALEAGADDYVTKPFRPRELVARLHANLRRAASEGEEPRVELNGLEIDLAARAVHRGGKEIRLTPIEFKLLAVLLRNRGRLLTHRVLLQQVWGPAYVGDRQTLRTHIANLRRKMEATEGVHLIRTEHRVGYRLADRPPDTARRGWPAENVIERTPGRGRLVALPDPRPAGSTRSARRRGSSTPYGRVA
jgi:two-component system KDP operon response regulator KdpE